MANIRPSGMELAHQIPAPVEVHGRWDEKRSRVRFKQGPTRKTCGGGRGVGVVRDSMQ